MQIMLRNSSESILEFLTLFSLALKPELEVILIKWRRWFATLRHPDGSEHFFVLTCHLLSEQLQLTLLLCWCTRNTALVFSTFAEVLQAVSRLCFFDVLF